jgi:hypothetical protein
VKRPYGITLDIACNKSGWPSILIYQQRNCEPWPKAVEPDPPSPDRLMVGRYFGFKLDIMLGTLRFPVKKLWKKEFWKFSLPYADRQTAINPWNSGNHWFVLTIPYCPGFFISCGIGGKYKQPGFYFGFKTYQVNRISSGLINYYTNKYEGTEENPVYTWASKEEQGNIYMCLSTRTSEDILKEEE